MTKRDRSKKPVALKVDADQIPLEMKLETRWVLWKYVKKRGENAYSKLPFQTTGDAASSVDAPTWSTFESVLQRYRKGGYDGIGFVLGDGWCGIDYDDVIADNKISQWAASEATRINSYTEFSPSKTGMKTIVKGSFPQDRKRAAVEGGSIEIYQDERYFTITGRKLPPSPDVVHDRTVELADLYERRIANAARGKGKPVVGSLSTTGACGSMNCDRVLQYVLTIESIQGQNGSGGLVQAACAISHGYPALGMSRETMRDILSNWNQQKASPPWSDSELDRALDRAIESGSYKDLTAGDAAAHKGPSYSGVTFENDPLSDLGLNINDLGLSDVKPTADQTKKRSSTISEEVDNPHRLGRSFQGRFGKQLVYWRGEWFKWDGTYRNVTEDDVRSELIKSILLDFEQEYFELEAAWKALDPADRGNCPTIRSVTRAIVSDVMQAFRSIVNLTGVTGQPCWLDGRTSPSPEELIATKKCLVHLPTMEVHEPSPQLFSTVALGYEFNQSESCPVWESFLDSIWPQDLESIETLQEWFGYCLLPDTSQQKIGLVIGPPRCGKGTISRTLKQIIGGQNTASPTLHSLAGPFGLWGLLNSRLALIPDARLSNRDDSIAVVERLLSISGEDPQDIHRKNLPTLTAVRLPVKFLLLSNELPNLRDPSGAIMSRVLLWKLTRSFVGKEDRTLERKINQELAGILNWSIRGWQRLRQRGYFVQPAASAEMISALDQLSSPIREFITDHCLIGPEFSVAVAELFELWLKWCESNNTQHRGDKQTFGKNLLAAYPNVKVTRPRAEDGSGRRFRSYQGVGIIHGVEIEGHETEFEDFSDKFP